MKKGIQLYAIRSLCSRDLEAGLRTVSEIGYQGVEFAGFFGHSAGEVAGWLSIIWRPWAPISRPTIFSTVRMKP